MTGLETRALTRHRFHGEWNYTLLPAWRAAPATPAGPRVPGRRRRPGPRRGRAGQPVASGCPARTWPPWPPASNCPGPPPASGWRLHLDRGRSRRTRAGPAGPVQVHPGHAAAGRPATTGSACPTAISPRCSAPTTPPSSRPAGPSPSLLGAGHPALAPGPVRLRTPANVLRFAAAAGITIPDPPPRRRLRK